MDSDCDPVTRRIMGLFSSLYSRAGIRILSPKPFQIPVFSGPAVKALSRPLTGHHGYHCTSSECAGHYFNLTGCLRFCKYILFKAVVCNLASPIAPSLNQVPAELPRAKFYRRSLQPRLFCILHISASLHRHQ